MAQVPLLWLRLKMLLTPRGSTCWIFLKDQPCCPRCWRKSRFLKPSLNLKFAVRAMPALPGLRTQFCNGIADGSRHQPTLVSETVPHRPDLSWCHVECWKYAVKANQIQKQHVQQLQLPTPVPTHAAHSPPRPTKISPNLSAVSASTPLSTSPTKRCRWTDIEGPESGRCTKPRVGSPLIGKGPTSEAGRGRTNGIDATCRPEHEHDRQKAVGGIVSRSQPLGRGSRTVAPDPPSPESLEDGELRSP